MFSRLSAPLEKSMFWAVGEELHRLPVRSSDLAGNPSRKEFQLLF
jgi:hypothetical protein